MRRVVLTGVWLAVALVVSAPAPAHHSFAAYESTQTRTLTGTVVTFQWINPHVAFKLRWNLMAAASRRNGASGFLP